MNAALGMVLVLSALPGTSGTPSVQEPASTPASRLKLALMMPLEIPSRAMKTLSAAAPGIERAFHAAFSRAASFQVISRAEIGAMLGKVAQEQLAGCDAVSCLTEVADAMGVDFVVLPKLGLDAGIWTFQAALLARRTAEPVSRVVTRAAALDGLLRSMEPMSRQLAAVGQVSPQDPRLPERLGTTHAAADEVCHLQSHNPDLDITRAWNSVIIKHNRESDLLAFSQGLVLLMGGMGLMLTGPLQIAGLGVFVMAFLAAVVRGTLAGTLTEAELNGPDPLSVKIAYPWMAIPLGMAPWPLMLIPGALAVPMALLLFAVDALDLSRIPVDGYGCCRDDVQLAEAEEPGLIGRSAPVLALLGAALPAGAMFTALGTMVGTLSIGMLVGIPILIASEGKVLLPLATMPMGPVVNIQLGDMGILAQGLSALSWSALTLATIPYALASGAAALLMVYHQRSRMVDPPRIPEQKKSAQTRNTSVTEQTK